MNEIMNKEIKMNSVEVCELINQFRELEHGKSKLEHADLMKKIRKEIEGLELLGFIGEGIFSESSYLNTQNKEQPCFSLNRDAVIQICASESIAVRYKMIEYINKLEEEVKNKRFKADLLLSIYDGGQDAILASKQLTELETAPLLETIEEQKPKVEFAEKLLKTKDNILVREYAKVLCDEGFNIGEKKLFKWLRDGKYLMSTNEPYLKFIDNKTFLIKVGMVDTPFGQKQTRTTLITPEGQLYLFKKIKEHFGVKNS